jgi:hypothetical protein
MDLGIRFKFYIGCNGHKVGIGKVFAAVQREKGIVGSKALGKGHCTGPRGLE